MIWSAEKLQQSRLMRIRTLHRSCNDICQSFKIEIPRLLIPFFFFVVWGSPLSFGQVSLELEKEYACAAQPGPIQDVIWHFPPSKNAKNLFQEQVDNLGLSGKQIRLHAADLDNELVALAYVHPVYGTQHIFYSQEFVSAMQTQTKNVWVWRVILAHELAHHLEGHLATPDQSTTRRMEEELEADRFAGSVLARYGASEEDLIAVVEKLGGGDGYPPVKARIAAARNGWRHSREDQETDEQKPDVRAPMKCPENLGGEFYCPSVECTSNSIIMYGAIKCATKKAQKFCSQTNRSAIFEKEIGKEGQWPIMRYLCV